VWRRNDINGGTGGSPHWTTFELWRLRSRTTVRQRCSLLLPTGSKCAAALVEYGIMRYRVYLEPDEDGVFVATCPTLPGCVSQGRTRLEATDNIREAIEGYLKSLRKHGDPVPPSILEEVIEVAGG
jgi:antitoxin HicB